MKNIFVILLVIPLITNAQIQKKGYIYDIETNVAISYSTIIVRGNSIGAICDGNGYFQFSVPDTLSLKAELVITSMGYENKVLKLGELSEKIYLKKAFYNLPEIVIKPKRTSKQIIGVERFAQKTGNFGTCSQMNLQAVLYIPNNQQLNGWIKTVSFHIDKNRGIPNTPFRIRIFDKDITLQQPGNNILNKSIIISGDKNGGWVTAFIDSLHVPFLKEGIFIGLEWLYDGNKFHYKYKHQKGIDDCYGQCISITDNISEHRTWMRDLFNNEWRLRDWWYSDKKKTKPNNIMVRAEIEYDK